MQQIVLQQMCPLSGALPEMGQILWCAPVAFSPDKVPDFTADGTASTCLVQWLFNQFQSKMNSSAKVIIKGIIKIQRKTQVFFFFFLLKSFTR